MSERMGEACERVDELSSKRQPNRHSAFLFGPSRLPFTSFAYLSLVTLTHEDNVTRCTLIALSDTYFLLHLQDVGLPLLASCSYLSCLVTQVQA